MDLALQYQTRHFFPLWSAGPMIDALAFFVWLKYLWWVWMFSQEEKKNKKKEGGRREFIQNWKADGSSKMAPVCSLASRYFYKYHTINANFGLEEARQSLLKCLDVSIATVYKFRLLAQHSMNWSARQSTSHALGRSRRCFLF